MDKLLDCKQLVTDFAELIAVLSDFSCRLNDEEQKKDIFALKITRKELEMKYNKLFKQANYQLLDASWKFPGGYVPPGYENVEIHFDFDKEIKKWQEFYQHFNLDVKINKEEFREIWIRNKNQIIKIIEKYGFDTLMMIPEGLPEAGELAEKVIGGIPLGFGDTIKPDEMLFFPDGIKDSDRSRIVLTHGASTTNHHYFLAAIRRNVECLDIDPEMKSQKYKMNIFIESSEKEPVAINNVESLNVSEYLILFRLISDKNGRVFDNYWGSQVVDKDKDGKFLRFRFVVSLPNRRMSVSMPKAKNRTNMSGIGWRFGKNFY